MYHHQVITGDMRFATNKRAHFELCVLVPEVFTKTESLEETVKNFDFEVETFDESKR